MIRIAHIIGVLILWLGTAVWAHAQSASQLARAWTLRSVENADTGAFAWCVAEAVYDNNLSLLFARSPSGETNLAIGIPGGTLSPGVSFEAMLNIDGGLQRTLVGVVQEPDLIVIPLKDDNAFYEGLRRGSLLTIEGGLETVFTLTGTSNALEGLRSCAAEGGGSPSDQTRITVPTGLVDMLRQAGFSDPQFIPMSGPRESRAMDYAWEIGPVIGGVQQSIRKENERLDDLMLSYIDTLEARCSGEFSVEMSLPELVGDTEIGQVDVSCLGGSAPDVAVSVVLYLVADQITVFVHESAHANADAGRAARDSMRAVIDQAAQAGTLQ